MKLSVDKEDLVSGLQAVQSVVANRPNRQILSNILLKAYNGMLELTGTDLDVSVVCSIPAKVDEEGELTLPAKKFFGITRELQVGDIRLQVAEDWMCSIQCGNSFFRLKGIPSMEFPLPESLEAHQSFVIKQEIYRDMLRKTQYAISSDESRYVLNGIFHSIKEGKLTMVATDGRRMAMVDQDTGSSDDMEIEAIVPTKAVAELTRLLSTQGDARITLSETHIQYELSGEGQKSILVLAKLVDGKYPNYRQVIPKQVKYRIAMLREEFIYSLKRAEIMTSDKMNSVKMTFGGNLLTITANTPDVGEVRETLAVKFDEEEISVAFNPSYLIDPLKIVDDDEVYFELLDQLSPGVLKINGPFLYVIMPMRVN
nr:DNA polymerase III subunit beta [Cytophagales bacterium]